MATGKALYKNTGHHKGYSKSRITICSTIGCDNPVSSAVKYGRCRECLKKYMSQKYGTCTSRKS